MDNFDFDRLEEELSDSTSDAFIESIRAGAKKITLLAGGIYKDSIENGLPERTAQFVTERYLLSILTVILHEGEAI